MIKKKVVLLIEKIKELHGDPHYVAFGIAIGVFIGITPTIPFHMIIAILLAFLFKVSKPAAILGVWISNPFTVVFLYFACYKVGHFVIADPIDELKAIQELIEYFEQDATYKDKILYSINFIRTKLKTFMVINLGGVILGLPSGIIAYFLTKQIIKTRKHS